MLAKGNIENIGEQASPMRCSIKGTDCLKTAVDTRAGYGVALSTALDLLLQDSGVLSDIAELRAIGFKTVHAGALTAPALITPELIKKMEEFSGVVPAHNPPYIRTIRQCRSLFPGLPLVAVFETDFHKSMPDYAYTYSIPLEWSEQYGIRRYGFHGSSHRYITARTAALLNRPVEKVKLISCHLGGSSSVTAVQYGSSIDQSMGFSAQAGVPMSTRCGDIDPFIIPYLMEKEGLSFEEVFSALTARSGLLGISGVSGDMRELERRRSYDYSARLAVETFCYSVKKYIGSYIAVLQGADALVFTGGIGENSPLVRERICAGLQFIGLELDIDKNRSAAEPERFIQTAGSRIKIAVVPTNEELVVARETFSLLCNN